jgi:hypothetical protein
VDFNKETLAMSETSLLQTPIEADERAPAPLFTLAELGRVGTAATLIVVVGTIIILTLMIVLGHYSSLSHSGPKAVWDGLVIALLIGARGRWRCLALLGTVYGLVLLIQIGVAYLVIVMAMAGIIAAGLGWFVSIFHRGAAIMAAAACYELLCGFGAPIKIYFGTADGKEPLLWALWFAEWPLRIGGAMLGVWLAGRWIKRQAGKPAPTGPEALKSDSESLVEKNSARHAQQARSLGVVGFRLMASIVACVAPLMIQNAWVLASIALAYVVYALLAGVRRGTVHSLLGLLWTWMVFSAASYLWHHDLYRVLDLLRTLVLRFAPLTLASVVLVATVRPLDLIRLLRRLKLSPIILIPLSTVARNIPHSRREFRRTFARLKRDGDWTGPLSLFRRPRRIVAQLFGPTVRRWMEQLAQ